MKRWAYWSQRVIVAGSLLVGTLLTAATQALALTDAEVATRLRSVPVFAITTPDGAPLVNTVTRGDQSVAVAEVYISWHDAEAFLQSLQQANPDLAGQVTIKPLSLGEIFSLVVEAPDGSAVPRFSIIPMEAQVTAARTLLQEQGQAAEDFQGVPLFYAESTQEGGGYLTITQGEEQVIPIYFQQEDLQTLLSRVSQQDPSLANTMQVQVTTLESLIGVLQTEDDPTLNNIFLVPLVDSLEYIQEQTGQGAPATPAP